MNNKEVKLLREMISEFGLILQNWEESGEREPQFKTRTSRIYVDKNKKYVLKEAIRYNQYDLIKREAHVLNLLNLKNFIWAPKLIRSENKLLMTEYCGEGVNERNIPSDYKIQSKKILQDLKELNIKHNDIKKSEILIKSGVVCLCDFGWASINDDFSCGRPDINNLACIRYCKLNGASPDKNIIKILDDIYDEKIKKTPVSHRRNSSGSQSEEPKIRFLAKTIKVSGYQKYNISIKDKKIQPLNREGKYEKIKNTLLGLRHECVSLADIGCSSGIVSYTANELGYSPVFSLDHDQEYLDIINQINTKLSIGSIHVKKFSFGDSLPKADVITMGALIHWVYSCTALYGSFDNIFSYLNNSINKYLIIEWIDNDDRAIRYFGHTSHNKNIHAEEYNEVNFKNSLEKNIGNIMTMEPISSTRNLYVVKKNN